MAEATTESSRKAWSREWATMREAWRSEAWEAAAGAEEELGGGLGEEAASGADGAQGVVDHGEESGAVEPGVEVAGGDDPRQPETRSGDRIGS